MPANAAGLVLFVHGSGSSRQSPRNIQIAEALHRVRIATLLLELLTAEEQARERESGQGIDIGLLALRLVDATEWAAARADTQGLRIGYFGVGTGAAAALSAAAVLGERVGAIVSRGGRLDLAGNALERVAAPTLLIVGARDTATIELNRQAFGRIAAEKELVLVPNATHLFEELGALEIFFRFATDWFARYLSPEAGAPRTPSRIRPAALP